MRSAFSSLRKPMVIAASRMGLVLFGLALGACGGDEPAGPSSDAAGRGSGRGGGGGEGTSTGESGAGASGAGSGGGGQGGGATTTVGVGGAGGAGTTTSTSSGQGGGGPACPGLGDPCTECMAVSCEATYCACYGSTACGAISACTQPCAAGDADCIQSCFGPNEAGIADYLLAVDCAANACAVACPTAVALDPCTKCSAELCAPKLESCLADDECYELVLCVLDCPEGDDFCVQQCGFEHLSAVDQAADLQECASQSCPVECG